MNWRDHSRLTGKHALLGASNYHWLNYDADRLTNAVLNYQAKERGTRLHAFAAECIDLKQKLPKNKKTLNTYVNDAIGFRMDTEQVLYYSDNCYGTADAISFNDGFLRIHDLKTGAIAEVLGCRPGLRQFLQGLMGLVSSYIFGFRAFTMFNLHWA